MLFTTIYAIAPFSNLKEMEDNYNAELRKIAKWEEDNDVQVISVNKEMYKDAEHFLVWYVEVPALPPTK
jgi:hypothetical protein